MNKQIIASGLFVPEGPCVLPDGSVAFVEMNKGRVSKLVGDEVEVVSESPGAQNGLTFGSDGHIYAAQNGGGNVTSPGIQRVSLEGEVTTITTTVGGIPTLAPNDLCFGPDGGLWFTDPAHGFNRQTRGQAGRLFVLGEADGELLLEVGPAYPNGIGFSIDEELLWVETYDRHVCRLGPGNVREEICQLPEEHLPDGFAVADDGRVFIATATSHGVTVISPEGEVLDHVMLEADSFVSNCCFDGSRLWVTDFGDVANRLDAGRLWLLETDAVGKPLHRGSLSEVIP